jgi:NitT/TauT family transport system substrate-binding protein
MPRVFSLAAVFFALLVLPVQAAQKLTFTVPSINMFEAPYLVAQQKGYFAEEGLDVDFLVANGGVATPALLSGSVVASASSASALAAIMKGAPLRVVLVQQDRAVYQLWSTRPDIHNLGDLKGKQIGIETRGDAGEVATRIALQSAGMPPDSVGYVPLGTANASSAVSGVLPAFVLATTDIATLRTGGGLDKAHLVMDYGKSVQLPINGMAVAQKLITDQPDVLRKMMRAIVKGMRYTRAFKAQTIAIVLKLAPAENARALAVDYEQYTGSLTPRLEVSNDLIRADLDVRAILLSMPRESVPPIDAIYNFAPLRAAEADVNASRWKPTP